MELPLDPHSSLSPGEAVDCLSATVTQTQDFSVSDTAGRVDGLLHGEGGVVVDGHYGVGTFPILAIGVELSNERQLDNYLLDAEESSSEMEQSQLA
ncbi:MAG: hypothetical protein Q9219_005454 [cf. Caloplaca sp. 3 TL-2023]